MKSTRCEARAPGRTVLPRGLSRPNIVSDEQIGARVAPAPSSADQLVLSTLCRRGTATEQAPSVPVTVPAQRVQVPSKGRGGSSLACFMPLAWVDDAGAESVPSTDSWSLVGSSNH